MKLRTIELEGKTYALVQDGKPLYEADGKEIAHDAAYSVATITRLNGEAKAHREAKEAAEAKLKAYEGIDDAEAARKALETVANLDSSKLLAADKVDEIKRGVTDAVEAKYAGQIKALGTQIETLTAERDGLNTALNTEVIGGAFARSKFIADKLILPPDIAESRFGKHFKVEDGKAVAYDDNGTKIYSRAKPDQPADIDEALEVLVDTYPRKGSILRGTGHSGADSREGQGGGGKTMTRAQFDALPQADRAAKFKDGYTVTD